MKILICDDEYTTRLITRAYLDNYQVEIIEASSGEEAIKVIKEEKPDVLIVDYNMPGMTGLDVIKNLNGSLPVIVATSEGFTETTEKELKKYASQYLVKPITEDHLIRMIEKTTGKKIGRLGD